MEEHRDERRKHRRIPLNVELNAQILNPEDTISSKMFKGRISNITERDARITLFDVSSRYYRKLIKDPYLRFIRLHCSFPPGPEETRLLGKIVYFDYHGKPDASICEIALQFCEPDEAEKEKLRTFLSHVRDHPKS